MAFTSDRPLTVDGVRLDTYAWNIEAKQLATAGRRTSDLEVPGVDGVRPSLNDPLNASQMGLSMFVRGTDADGVVPGGQSARDVFRANLDELVHLFGKRHALLEIRQTTALGVERRMWAKVTDSIAPDINTPGSAARFTVGLQVPAGVWEDVNTIDWTSGSFTNGQTLDLTALDGGTERITDAVLLVQGPITNPRITDPATGMYVQLEQALVSTTFWRVNVGTWASRYGSSLGLGSADTTGSQGQPYTLYGGTRRQTQFVHLTPIRSGTNRRIQLQVGGTGITTATRLSVRARRKFAL